MCLTRLPEGVNLTIPRNALRKNASGVAMQMKIGQSETPQLDLCTIETWAKPGIPSSDSIRHMRSPMIIDEPLP